ncbi:hemolysin family protein [Peredibacter sp. HCB2-198]|uniref:hemolysin family protein n=1 Tax=Peredibacter sp. HCB2-198 TaxID=3383025 RepID=UPI0038B6A8CF
MLDFLIVAACLVVNAFFSAYEMAFVTITREEIDELEDQKSIHKRLTFFKKKPERTLSVIQIGITLVGAIAAAVGGTGAVESLEPYIVENYGVSNSVAEAIAVMVVIAPLTYFSVVFGELVPKTVALKHPLKIIGIGTPVLSFIDSFLSPIVTFLEISTNSLLKVIGIEGNEEDESMGQSVEIGNLPEYHQKFVKNLVALKGRNVSKAMIPWEKVAHLNFSDSEEEVRHKMASAPHSRFPVIDGDVVVGILLKKDLPDSQIQNQMPWQGVLRSALKVPDSERVLEAFLRMQEKQTQLAVVENKEAQFVGIITIEDIIEEVVGDINDRADSMTSRILSNRPKISLKK